MTNVDDFFTYCADARNWTPNTIKRYGTVLAALSRADDPFTIDTTDLEQWWQERIYLPVDSNARQRKRAHSSRANELACLRSFYNWATKFDHRPDDPTRRLDFPQYDNHIPRPIPEASLTRLLGALTESAPDLRRAIALGAYAGLRVSEAAGLDWASVDEDANRLYVRGKGRKERVLGASPLLLDKIQPNTGGNVVTAGGKPYAADTLQRRINRLMAANLPPVRPATETEDAQFPTYHALRKRAATLVMSRVRNPIAATQAFGWASVQTAQSYAQVGDEMLDEIAAAMI